MPKLNPGLMQDYSLTIPTLLEHAATNHGGTEVVARMLDGSRSLTRTNSVAQQSSQAR